jgi:hypothetical protein
MGLVLGVYCSRILGREGPQRCRDLGADAIRGGIFMGLIRKADRRLDRFQALSGILALVMSLILLEPLAEGADRFIRGKVTGQGELSLTDAINILGHLFLGGPDLACLDAADADDSGKVDLTDAVQVLSFLFLGGPPPAEPYPSCGIDQTPDSLGCDEFPACPQERRMTVTGRIVDETQAPVAGATVEVGADSVLSGPDGRFALEEIPALSSFEVRVTLGNRSSSKQLQVQLSEDLTLVEVGDLLLLPVPPCINVIARAADRGCGRIFVWGGGQFLRENGPTSEPFGEKIFGWLSERTCDGGQRTKIGTYEVPLSPNLRGILEGKGMEVREIASLTDLEGIEILYAIVNHDPGPTFLKEWVEEGGAVMVGNNGWVGRPEIAGWGNSLLAGLGIEYDPTHEVASWPMVFETHPTTEGIGPENIFFVTGFYVVEVDGIPSDPIARFGPCQPRFVPDCRKPLGDPGPVHEVPVDSDCTLRSTVRQASGGTELNLIGVYTSPTRDIQVTVSRLEPMILVLSAYDSIRWIVDATPGTTIERVIVLGYEEQIIEAPPGLEVEIHWSENGDPLGTYGFGDDCGGGHTAQLVESMETHTGLTLRSFHGCHDATTFTLR